MKDKTRGLRPRWERFAMHYIANGCNASEAAVAAGFLCKDDRTTGHRLQHHPAIQERIAEYTRERLKGVMAKADEVLYLLADHMRGNLGMFVNCFDDEGHFDLEQARNEGKTHLIKKLKVTSRTSAAGVTTTTTEIELHDSQAAAARLAKLLGMEQAPRVNQDDIERVNREIARLVANGYEAERAKELILKAEPNAAQWLM